jgi:hypothetical protein
LFLKIPWWNGVHKNPTGGYVAAPTSWNIPGVSRKNCEIVTRIPAMILTSFPRKEIKVLEDVSTQVEE